MSSRLAISFVGAVLVIAATGCSKSDQAEVSTATAQATQSPGQTSAAPPAATETAGDGAFACTLLTKEEAQAAQGEPFKEAKSSQKSGSGLTVSQCYFELPTTVNSIVLTVTQRGEGDGGRDPKQSWQELFHRDKASEKKKEKEEHGPEKIEGLGDEAFWTGSRVGGALYVLKGNSFIRVSIGGAGDRPEKIEKSKTLARSVLNRL